MAALLLAEAPLGVALLADADEADDEDKEVTAGCLTGEVDLRADG